MASSHRSDWFPTVDDSLTGSVERNAFSHDRRPFWKVCAPWLYICWTLTYRAVVVFIGTSILWCYYLMNIMFVTLAFCRTVKKKKPNLKRYLRKALREQVKDHLKSQQRDATEAKGCFECEAASASTRLCSPHVSGPACLHCWRTVVVQAVCKACLQWWTPRSRLPIKWLMTLFSTHNLF